MFRIAQERLTPEVQEELHALVRGYYASTDAKDGLPPYDFCWEIYQGAARQGALYLVTARVQSTAPERQLAGFGLYLVMDHPHHRGFLLGDCDTLAVAPEFRGRGIGQRLIETAEVALRRRGVVRMIHRHRIVYGETALFPELGFRAEELTFFKDL